MSFDMFSNNQNDDMDPNYIYPRPYIDPMMYFNPYAMNNPNQMNQSMNMANYMTYMNPFMANPLLGQEPMDNDPYNYQFEEDDMDEIYNFDNMYNMNSNMNNNMSNSMQGMMPNMMMPCIPGMPGMPQSMMFPGMMMPNMMMPNMMMPNMPMYPFMQMMPGMEAINVEEFDEEEM